MGQKQNKRTTQVFLIYTINLRQVRDGNLQWEN